LGYSENSSLAILHEIIWSQGSQTVDFHCDASRFLHQMISSINENKKFSFELAVNEIIHTTVGESDHPSAHLILHQTIYTRACLMNQQLSFYQAARASISARIQPYEDDFADPYDHPEKGEVTTKEVYGSA
jgi:hypothetical protein